MTGDAHQQISYIYYKKLCWSTLRMQNLDEVLWISARKEVNYILYIYIYNFFEQQENILHYLQMNWPICVYYMNIIQIS